MKRIESILLILVISVFTPLSISAQGYLEVYLKNGMHHRFYLDTFKELRTSKQSVDGMLSSDYITQQVVMNDSTYSYALADVDSIRFKKVTMDDMVDDMFTVLNEISPMLSDVNDITEAERFVDDIKACHNVRDAYVSGTSLIVEMMNINYIFVW